MRRIIQLQRIFREAVENSVKFVKTSYFSARSFTSIEEVVSTLPRWLERKNRRIHQSTFRVPKNVLEDVEKAALAPMLASVYEAYPTNLIGVTVNNMPFVSYRSSKYSVPWDCCFSKIYYKAVHDKLLIYGSDRRHLCTHIINPIKGSFNRLDEHAKEPSTEWLVIAESMRRKYDCFDFQHFINGFKKENERHLARQLQAVEGYLDEKKPSIRLVAEVMAKCCNELRYRFSQFKVVYELCEARLATPEAVKMSGVEKRSLESYQIIFEERCAG